MHIKKILFITHQLTRTGAPNVLLDMIKCCREYGHAVAVISLSDGPARKDWEESGVDLSIIPNLSVLGDQMIRIMKKFDTIAVNTLVCCEIIPLCVESGTDTVWWIHEHENYFEYYREALPSWDEIKDVVRVYGVSPVTVRLLTKMAGYQEVGLLPFYVPEITGMTPKNNNRNSQRISFICIGVYAYVKGQDILCSAIRRLPESLRDKCVFHFYGDRSEVDMSVYSPVAELAEEFECVECHDSVPHDVMLRIIAGSDYMVIPSRKEPMPTVAVEAMMLGTPCIISDICGVTDFLKDGESALFFPAGDDEKLTEVIESAVSNISSEIYENISIQARQVYENNFGLETFQSGIHELFESEHAESASRKIILCRYAEETPELQRCLDILEKEYGTLEIVGDMRIEQTADGYGISEIVTMGGASLDCLAYDYILVLGDDSVNRSQAVRFLENAASMERRCILPDKVVCLSGFSVERYETLIESNLSIISSNCAAGMLYHLLGLPFLSPTINMFQHNDSFLRFVSDLYGHLSKPVVFEKMEKEGTKEYPVFSIGDAILHMNHYSDPEDAASIWYKRLGRLNPDNILIMMFTDDKEEVAAFHYLPFKKKVCFVPFPCDLPDVYPIPPSIDRNAEFWQLVLAVADGSLECYDLFDMLIEGKKTQIIEF